MFLYTSTSSQTWCSLKFRLCLFLYLPHSCTGEYTCIIFSLIPTVERKINFCFNVLLVLDLFISTSLSTTSLLEHLLQKVCYPDKYGIESCIYYGLIFSNLILYTISKYICNIKRLALILTDKEFLLGQNF